MKKLIVILIFLSNTVSAQYTPLLSQYMFNTVALNPAFTGNEGAFTIVSSNRIQWVGFDGAPTTLSLTAHAPVKKTNSSLGLQLFADQIGIDKKMGAFGSYSYKLAFNKYKLSLGLSGGVSVLKSYYSRLNVIDQGDEAILVDSPIGVLPDLGFGAHFFNEKYFVSFSIPMMLTHTYEQNGYKVSNKIKNYNYIIGGGTEFTINREIKLAPSFLSKFRANNAPQFDINLMAKYKSFIEVGMSFRTNEALVGLFKINLDKQLSFMYSYGGPINGLSKYTSGSHEISLKYVFLYQSKIAGPRSFGW